jgi:protein-S-isoprenylcysteine O-methyltransferase Ste14
MARLLAALYGGAVYLIFLVTFAYAIAFVGNLPVVGKTIDSGTPGPLPAALLVNAVLLAVFAIQHSVMARRGFKRWWTRFVPKPVERSTYVLFASLALALILWQWRPIGGTVWALEGAAAAVVDLLFWVGWGILLLSTVLLNHFELFGLTQVRAGFRGQDPSEPVFRTPLLYKWSRHPLYLGFLIAFWSAPTMTFGHLLFSLGCTGYILLGIFLEERDLIADFGEQYRDYRRRVGMFFTLPGRRRKPAISAPSQSLLETR